MSTVAEAAKLVRMAMIKVRAPTDDSIRLYGEMLDKARAEILSAIPLRSNTLEGMIILRRLDPTRVSTNVVVRFVLNNVPHAVELVVNDLDEPADRSATIRLAVAGHIVDHILKHAKIG